MNIYKKNEHFYFYGGKSGDLKKRTVYIVSIENFVTFRVSVCILMTRKLYNLQG